ncbi:unnamed protein product [Strongylus vulgaris]|uniref:Uncharacterized protein n=1 Tax=Strongylus vulgaris TaxID=40348 RepID=A0A3P7IFQ0_STRVU|nr:unnamed protein product [Strongylus vulgaris]
MYRTREWIPRKAKGIRGKPPSKADVFVAWLNQLNPYLVTITRSGPRKRRRRSSIQTSWMTLAREETDENPENPICLLR